MNRLGTTAAGQISRTARLCRTIILLAALAWPSCSFAQEPIKLGVFPYLSAQKLAALHKPLKEQVARCLGVPVRLLSAPDFATFIQRTREKQYDLILTAPHMGRLAENQTGYIGLVKSGNISRAVFVVRRESQLAAIADLHGKTVTLPPRQAIIHHLALQTMSDAGLKTGKDIQIVAAKSHNAALQDVLQNKSAVVAFGKPTWDSCPEEQKQQLKVIGVSNDIPGFLLMAHPAWREAQVSQLIHGLLAFAETPQGETYFSATRLVNFERVDEPTMLGLDPYVKAIFGETFKVPGD